MSSGTRMLQPIITSKSLLTSAEICRANGWGPGTILEGDRLPKESPEMPLPRIQITAIGVQALLVIRVDAQGNHLREEEGWNLKTRDWRAVN